MDLSPSHNQSLEDMDRANVFHPFTPPAQHMETGPLVMASAKGSRLTDIGGKTYLDGLAGLWCVNVGYGREEIADAIAEQAKVLPYYHSFASMGNAPSIHTAETVKRMAPANMARVLFGCSGSDANDTQVKLVWYYNNLRGKPEKKKILSRDRAYHGVTVASGSLTGLPMVHNAFDLPIPQVKHLTCPHYYREGRPGESEADFCDRLVAELSETIAREGADTIAAFIAEPVMGAGGVVVPPEGYYKKIAKVLKDNDILFIADEVICGFGRLGTPFGSNYFGIEPDMMTVAKGITSGYQPLSAVLVGEAVWRVIESDSAHLGVFGHGYTYTAHPIACAAANANLAIIEREKLVERAGRIGAYFHAKLHARFDDHPAVGEVRGAGMMAAVELVSDRASKGKFNASAGIAKGVAASALARGLIARPMVNDTMAMSPPLILTEAEADEIVDTLAAAIDDNLDAMREAGATLA